MNQGSRYLRGCFVVTLVVVLATGSLVAQQPPPQKPPEQPAQPAQPFGLPGQPAKPAAPPVNKEEEDAYKAFFELKSADPAAIASSGEEFLKKFPESRYREFVYSRLTGAYFNLGKVDQVLVAAEKALEINPDNVDVLSVLSYSMLRRFDPNALDAEQKLQKAEGIAKHGMEVLNAMPKPPTITEEDFTHAKNEKIAMCHSGLGLAYLHRQRYADAAVELEQATALTASPDPTDLYLLGAVYQNSKRFKEAAETYSRCGEMEWDWQDRCKQLAKNAKQLAAQAEAAAPPKPKEPKP